MSSEGRERPFGEPDPPPPPAPRTYRDGGGSGRRLLAAFVSAVVVSAAIFGVAFFFGTPKPAAPKTRGGHTHDVLPSGELGPARCE